MTNRCLHPVPTARCRPAPGALPSSPLPWRRIGLVAVLLGGLAVAGSWLWPGRRGAEEVSLASRVGGRVAVVNVAEGQRVEAGQVLVTLEAQELTARRDQAAAKLAAAQAALERVVHGPLAEEIAEARAAAEAARARLERTLAGPREELIRQAQGERNALLAEQRQAEEEYGRAERLVRTAAISRAEYGAALAVREKVGQRARAARAALDLLLHGSRPEEIAEARADWERLQAHWELLRRGAREEDRAEAAAVAAEARAKLAEAEAVLRETVVTAAERGLVAAVTVRPGNVAAAGQPVVVVRRATVK